MERRTTPLRFHWSLSQAGNALRRGAERDRMPGVPDFAAQLELCRRAEEHGVDSMLMAVGYTRPDPLLLSLALGLETERIRFMVACRAGLLSPVAFVQQVNTASAVLGGLSFFVGALMTPLTGVIGYYTMVSMTLNAHEIPLPDGASAPLALPPGGGLTTLPAGRLAKVTAV